MPGMEVSMEGLMRRAARLFMVEPVCPENVIGHNTQTALRSGMFFGYASMIDGMVERFKKEVGEDARVIATGGVSLYLKGISRQIQIFDSELTIKGISYLYESIRKK